MCLNGKEELSETGALRLRTIIRILITKIFAKTPSILATIIDAEIVKIKTSFLASEMAEI